MVTVKPVADGVYQISAPMRFRPRVLTLSPIAIIYFVADQNPAIIDPGPGNVWQSVVEGLKQLGCPSENVAYIIPTHIHLDHAGGAGHLARAMPQAKVIAHQRGAPHLIDPSRLIEASRGIFGENMDEEIGEVIPVPQEQVRVVQDEEVISLGERELKFLYTPGHAPHHLSIHDSRTNGVFCGEALGMHEPGTDVVIPSVAPPIFEMEQALESIARLKKLNPSVLFYSHDTANHNVTKLIAQAEESTRSVGETILEGLRAGQTEDGLVRRIEAHTVTQATTYMKANIRLIVGGYIAYFRKKGLA